jgi:hypothetical protein
MCTMPMCGLPNAEAEEVLARVEVSPSTRDGFEEWTPAQVAFTDGERVAGSIGDVAKAHGTVLEEDACPAS